MTADTGPAAAPAAPGTPDDAPALRAGQRPAPPTGDRLLAELRAEIGRADNKAAVLIAALGLISGLFGKLVADLGRSASALPAGGRVLLWAGALSLVVSLAALLLAILPRYRLGDWEPGMPLTYFGDIRRAAGQGLLAESLARTEQAPQHGLVAALDANSRIVALKLRWVRVGLSAFAAGVVLLPGALLTA
ncbi:hypothetical protein GCM10009716_39880 [Streptomyces sodiiphilus]|uniref:Pycsar effector protein domain-containing protein n=1 Tax=Streptomyces sodiiphilus TaxID=226217 RepID=A0ABN2PT45_9ACTN